MTFRRVTVVGAALFVLGTGIPASHAGTQVAAAPTTTTTASTSSPATATTTTSSPAAAKLTWAPPVLSSPVTYRVSGDGPGTITAPAGQDSIVVWDAPTTRRIRFSGGRHWVIRGGEVNNSKAWPNPDDQSGLQFENATGTVFIEGMYIHGAYGTDGIRIGAGGSAMTVIVQNSRIIERFAGPTGYHADVIQPYGGVKELKVDRMTGSGDYQGQMWKQEPGTLFGPSDFRRVNYVATAPELNPMINLVMASPTQPITLTEVYNKPDPLFVDGNFCRVNFPAALATCGVDSLSRKYVTWANTPILVTGRVTQGLPPGGDFVPDGAAGMGYQSPGYL